MHGCYTLLRDQAFIFKFKSAHIEYQDQATKINFAQPKSFDLR